MIQYSVGIPRQCQIDHFSNENHERLGFVIKLLLCCISACAQLLGCAFMVLHNAITSCFATYVCRVLGVLTLTTVLVPLAVTTSLLTWIKMSPRTSLLN